MNTVESQQGFKNPNTDSKNSVGKKLSATYCRKTRVELFLTPYSPWKVKKKVTHPLFSDQKCNPEKNLQKTCEHAKFSTIAKMIVYWILNNIN